MTAAWILGRGHVDALDEDGRPLGEQASARYPDVERREVVRAFGDARDATGLPCNHAALAQLQGAWRPALDWLRSFDAHRPRDVERMHRRAFAATAQAPLAWVREGRISRRRAALHKLALGFSDLLARLLFEGVIDATDPPPPVEALDGWLDARPWLVGERQVCAGSRAQIRLAWRALSETGARAHRDPEIDALLERAAIEAAAASAARRLLPGASAPERYACARLAVDPAPPRLVSSILQVEDAGPLHASLLFRAPPPGLRAFFAALPAPDDPAALARVDAALTRAVRLAPSRAVVPAQPETGADRGDRSDPGGPAPARKTREVGSNGAEAPPPASTTLT